MPTLDIIGKYMIEISEKYGKLHIYELYESNHNSIIIRTWEDMDFDVDENGWKLR